MYPKDRRLSSRWWGAKHTTIKGPHADSPSPAAACEAGRERGRYFATRGMETLIREAELNMGKPHAGYATIGIEILNAVPSFFLLVNVRLPSCASTMFFTIVMPRPVPPSAPRV
jgi:hypothetical protein